MTRKPRPAWPALDRPGLDWNEVLQDARDRLLRPDPGGLRLRAALRTTLSGLIAWALALAAGTLVAVSTEAIVVAVAMGIYVAGFIRDPTPAARAVTILCAAPAAAAAVALGTLLAPTQELAAAAVIVIVFLAVYAPELGARWPALAQVVLGGFIFALLSRSDWSDLSGWSAAILAATLAGLLTHLVLLPDTPRTVLGRLEAGLRAEIGRILAAIDTALLAGAWTPIQRRRVLRRVDHLSGAATLAETAWVAPAAAMRLFELELLAERVAQRGLAQLPVQGDERVALRGLIAAIRGRPAHAAEPSPSPRSALAVTLSNLAALLSQAMPKDGPPPGLAAPAHGATAFPSAGLRHAVQAAFASGMAIACGELISPRRWYWAAMTAYVLFLGTRSRADSLEKGVQAVAGTLAGVVAGLLLASLLAGHVTLSILGIFVAVFLAFQASSAAYAVTTFWFTVTLGLMFATLGYLSRELLVLRLQETAIGAASGILTATLFLGSSIPTVARTAACRVLAALSELVRSATSALAGGPADAALPGLALALHARLAELRQAVQPRLRGLAGATDPTLRRQVVALTFCADWGRDLAFAAMAGAPTPSSARAAILRETAERIAEHAADLTRILGRQGRHEPDRTGALTPVSDLPTVAGLFDDDQDPSTLHVRLLLQIDSALERMRRRRVQHP